MAPNPDRALLLTPGAGSAADHASLVAVEEELAPVPVDRMDFGYRAEGRRFPDRAPKLIGEVGEGAAALADRCDLDPARIVLGGRSMGGRMCSMAVAEGLPALGLVLIAYPLHPPKQPSKLRIEHFPAVEVPCLFVSGTRDRFGAPHELEDHVAAIPGPTDIHWVEGRDHSLTGSDREIATVVADWVRSLRPPG